MQTTGSVGGGRDHTPTFRKDAQSTPSAFLIPSSIPVHTPIKAQKL